MITFKDNTLVDSTEWTKSNRYSNPCISDYTRFLKFARDLVPDEVVALRDYLEEWNCPGWTGVHLRKVAAIDIETNFLPKEYMGYYVAFTTWDSSG
jgi:hypothetical protein